jgi:glycosyltransferase involved in cell wall biosynthesis
MTTVAQVITPGPRTKDGAPTVLQVVPNLVTGGVERGAVDMAAALTKTGGTAIIASEGGPLEYELKRIGAIHVRLPMASKNPIVMARNIARLKKLILSENVDIVHARSRAPAWSAYYAAKATGRHFITTFHAPYNFSNGLKRRYNAIMTRGERVIAISEFIAGHIEQYYKVEPTRVRVVQRGVDLRHFDPDQVSAERVIKLATDWRLPDGVPLVLLPGRLTRWKGQSILLDALTELRDLDFCCVLVGSDQGRTSYRQELERQIMANGLAGKAFIFDNCSDMAAAYMLSDVVVSASTDPEGFGRVVSEGQAMGRPVVASDHGGAREQLIPGTTGFLFENGDPSSLASALRKALSLNSEERFKLSKLAITRVRTLFSKERMCNGTLGLYNELIRSDAHRTMDR